MEMQVHSLAQLAYIQHLCGKRDLEIRDAFFVANQLVNHGYREAGDVLAALRSKLPESAAAYLDRLDARHHAIQSLRFLKPIWADQKRVEMLLRTDGYLFIPGDKRQSTCVVIFTSKFNNFHFSNLILDAILSEFGIARLYLKDTTDFVYFHGVKDLASTFKELPQSIMHVMSANNIERVIITGFSSGGYAALYNACQIPGSDFIGFSTYTDISRGSALALPGFYASIRDQVSPDNYQDLKPLIAANRAGRLTRLYYGERDPLDTAHAQHLLDIEHVDLVEVSQASHVVTSAILEMGEFHNTFASVIGAD